MKKNTTNNEEELIQARINFKIKTRNLNNKSFFLLLVMLFFLFNIGAVVFVGIIPSIGRPYFHQKVMMRTAAAINFFYILPLSKAFGLNNPIALPFYAVRDALFKVAYNSYPKNEAEKDLNWYAIKYRGDYKELYNPLYIKYYNSNPEKLIKNNVLMNWTDEIYNHADLISKETIKDAYFKRFRFNIYNDLISNYITHRSLLFRAKNEYEIKPFLTNNFEIKRLENILDTLIKLEDYSKKNEPEGIDFFYNESHFWDKNLTINDALLRILDNRIIFQKFNCNDFYTKKYIENRKILINELNNPKIDEEGRKSISANLNWKLSQEVTDYINNNCRVK